jgi:hypothetical protein
MQQNGPLIMAKTKRTAPNEPPIKIRILPAAVTISF